MIYALVALGLALAKEDEAPLAERLLESEVDTEFDDDRRRNFQIGSGNLGPTGGFNNIMVGQQGGGWPAPAPSWGAPAPGFMIGSGNWGATTGFNGINVAQGRRLEEEDRRRTFSIGSNNAGPTGGFSNIMVGGGWPAPSAFPAPAPMWGAPSGFSIGSGNQGATTGFHNIHVQGRRLETEPENRRRTFSIGSGNMGPTSGFNGITVGGGWPAPSPYPTAPTTPSWGAPSGFMIGSGNQGATSGFSNIHVGGRRLETEPENRRRTFSIGSGNMGPTSGFNGITVGGGWPAPSPHPTAPTTPSWGAPSGFMIGSGNQ